MNQKTSSQFKYKVKINQPNLHYYLITIVVSKKIKEIVFNLPTWSPGSYLIRDYSTHLHNFEVKDSKGKDIPYKKLNHSSWKIFSNSKNFIISYKIYAFDHSVRTNFLDTEFGFINPPSTFLYPENFLNEKSELHFELNQNFKYVYTSLAKKKNFFISNNFDELLDSPIQLSNRQSEIFTSGNCKHEIIVEGNLTKSVKENLVKDLKTITKFEIDLMQSSPNKYYLFILHLLPNAYGGLEHSKSSVNAFDSISPNSKYDYTRLLALLAHEYFHLWNIKRIRPKALGPFDYQNPNYTNELWIAEGITSFYDNYILLRTNFYSEEKYLSELTSDLNRLSNSWGELNMSLEDSSFTAWNKFYKQNPNSHNTGISYYIKGSILVLCMYIYILKNSKNTFTEILIELYREYYIKKQRGFTKEEFFAIAKKITKIDLLKEFDSYLTKPIRIPIENYLKEIGISRIENNRRIDFGFETEFKKCKTIITKLFPTPAVINSDINLNDELIAINEYRILEDNYFSIIELFKEGEEVNLTLSRRDKLIQRKITLESKVNYSLSFDKEISEEVQVLRKKFFGKD